LTACGHLSLLATANVSAGLSNSKYPTPRVDRQLGRSDGNRYFDECVCSCDWIEQSNFHDYPVARIPRQIHVRIVQSQEPPAGVGEPGVPLIAPGIRNAIFAGTGKRIRDLPLQKHKLA
jgi:hypothetical protein